MWPVKNLIYQYVLRNRCALAREIESEIDGLPTRVQREEFQVERFNKIWATASASVPFYIAWRKRFNLPDKIRSLNELMAWPILTKDDLRHSENFVRTDVPEPKGRILTGGSTGTPVRLPGWFDKMAGVSQMIGRRRYGVSLADRVFLLWGHEHLYGTGFKRSINIYKRRLKDWIADWKRCSAYDLSQGAMRVAFDQLVACKPTAIIAYSPAMISFCRQNINRAGEIKSVKTIICSAGPLSQDEKLEISSFFSGAQICMEYGTVECGIIAYTNPLDGEYDVFWNTHLLQAERDSSNEFRAIVTRLTDCYVPLIRYDVGDYLELFEDEVDVCSVLRMKDVKGRPTELIKFRNGVEFFAWTIGDCVKQVPEIISHQVAVDEKNNRLEIRVVAVDALSDAQKSVVVDRLSRIVANCMSLRVSVVQVDELSVTVGGKTPRVVRL